MNNIEEQKIRVPLNPEAHLLAMEFAKSQRNSQKGKKVYLNTLAVYAVRSYLKWLRIDSDLTQGESWNPGMRALFDVADLVIPGIGKLECRRILPGETDCVLPIEVTEQRIGYVGVQFEENLKEVSIVGFIAEIDSLEPPEKLQLVDFEPINKLVDKIYLLESGIVSIQATPLRQKPALVNLGQWFENLFEAGWQPVEALLDARQNLSFGGIRSVPSPASLFNRSRAKLIEIGSQLIPYSVVLVVTLDSLQADSIRDIAVMVHAAIGQGNLPDGLYIRILNESGIEEMGAPARSDLPSIIFDFAGTLGERFGVQLVFGDVEVIEHFVI